MPNVYPATPENRWSGIVDGLVIGAVPAVLVAWWIRHVPGRWLTVMALAASGLLIAAIRKADWSNPGTYLISQRMTLGLSNNGGSFFAGIVLIGLLSLAVPLLVRTIRRGRVWWSATIVSALFSFFTIIIIVLSRSRQVWIAFCALALATLAWQLRLRGIAAIRTACARYRAAVLVGTAIAVLIVAVSGKLIVDRMGQESATWRALAALDFDQVPPSSIGERIGMWQVSADLIEKYPWLGIGPAAERGAFAAAHNQILQGRTFAHFHNTYINIAVVWGVPALVPWLVLLILLARGSFRSLRLPDASRRELAGFVLSAGFLFLIVCLVTVRHDDIHGGSLVTILIACALVSGSRMGTSPDGGNGGEFLTRSRGTEVA